MMELCYDGVMLRWSYVMMELMVKKLKFVLFNDATGTH